MRPPWSKGFIQSTLTNYFVKPRTFQGVLLRSTAPGCQP
nr:MAG TPA: hypothetical protein [Caudoviricetes sp.]